MILLDSMITTTNDSGESSQVKMFLALYDNSGAAGTDKGLLTIDRLIASEETSKGLMYEGYNLQFAKLKEFPNPMFLLAGNLPANVTEINIDPVFSVVQQQLNGSKTLSDGIKSQLIALLVKRGLTEQIANLVILCCYAKTDFTTIDHNLNVQYDVNHIAPEFLNMTKEWMNECIRRNTMAAIPHNETEFQATCTDELFIYLPMYEAMMDYLAPNDDSEDADEHASLKDLHTFMPRKSEVSAPYGSKAASYEDPATVSKMIELGGSSYELILKEIIGSSDHNTDEIFDNEKRYYDALNKWMGIIAEEEEGSDNGDMCATAMEYMHTLVETLYIWYWQHNTRVPCSIESSNATDTAESKYTFRTDDHSGNAPEDLIVFLDRAAADLGREVYAKAVIQLARWGSRKPTCIIFNGYKTCFDLNTGFTMDSRPSLASYTKEKINGCDYKFVGFINDTTRIADSNIGFKEWPMPVGVTLEQQYADKDNEQTIELQSYFSMIDVIKEIVLGNITVDGITYINDTWTVGQNVNDITIDEVLSNSKKEDQLQFPIFRGTGLIQIYSDLHIATPSNSDSQFSIMSAKLMSSKLCNFIDDNSFDTYAGFDNLTRNGRPGRKQAVDYMIVRDLLKVYHEAAINYSPDLDATGIFKLWHQAILNAGYVDEAYFYKGVTKPSVPLPGCHTENFSRLWWHSATPNVNVTQTITVSTNESTQPTPTSSSPQQMNLAGHSIDREVSFSQQLLMQPAADCGYVKFVDHNNHVVCYCAKNPRIKTKKNGMRVPDPVFIILDSATVQTLDTDKITQAYPVKELLVHMMKAFYTFVKEVPAKSNLRFINSEAVKEMHAYFKSID